MIFLPRIIDPTNPVLHRTHPLNQGLIGWWMSLPHNSGGGTLYDLMGLNHGALSLTAAGGAGWTSTLPRPGRLSSHIYFDGTSDYADCGGSPVFDVGFFTVAAWAYANAAIGTNKTIVSRFGAAGATDWHISNAGVTNKFAARVDVADVGTNLTSPSTYAYDTWHRIVLTYDGTTVSLYVDGQLATSASASGTADVQACNFNIGRRQNNTAYWQGGIDDVKFWKRALNVNEVLEDYLQSQLGYPDVLNFQRVTVLSSDLFTVSVSDAFSTADASSLAASLGVSDSGLLGEVSSGIANLVGSDSATLADVAALLATIATSDAINAGDGSSLDTGGPGSTPLGVSDDFTFSELASLAVQLSLTDAAALNDLSNQIAALAASDSLLLTGENADLVFALSASDALVLADASTQSVQIDGVDYLVMEDLTEGRWFATSDGFLLSESASRVDLDALAVFVVLRGGRREGLTGRRNE